MANTKLYDLAVVTGEYTNKEGEIKKRYENVGAVWEGDKGQYMVMKRTFNPAGVPAKEGSDSIFLSMFAPKDEGSYKSNKSSKVAFDQVDVPF